MGEEVFRFQLSLYPSATEGEGYADTSKVDGKVTLRLGCIKVVYLHKFLVSLLVRSPTTVSPGSASARCVLVLVSSAATQPLCASFVSLFLFYLNVVSVSLFLLFTEIRLRSFDRHTPHCGSKSSRHTFLGKHTDGAVHRWRVTVFCKKITI